MIEFLWKKTKTHIFKLGELKREVLQVILSRESWLKIIFTPLPTLAFQLWWPEAELLSSVETAEAEKPAAH